MENSQIEKAKNMVKEIDLDAEFIMHEKSGKTTEEAAVALGVTSDNILKTLILYASNEDKYIGTIILGNNRLDFDKVAELSNVKIVRFAQPDQIEKLTGFKIGGVPPIAVKLCNESFIDEKVVRKSFVIGAGGDEHFGLKFNPSELQEKLNLKVSNISQ